MNTLTTFTQRYGRFEARIKLPAGQGLWPAFWIEGANVNQVSWPACGEVDIIEKNGTKPNELEGFAHMPAGQYSALSPYPAPLASAFHVYGIDWTPQGITWTVDGKSYGHMSAFPGWPFNHPFFLILNLAVGGYWPGPPSASTRFPARMLVDWIRVYKQTA
jgi:beta-glucanase (GH16 family)